MKASALESIAKRIQMEFGSFARGGVMPNVKQPEAEVKKILSKPPIGLLPRRIHTRRRVDDILRAMRRYNEVGKRIPNVWFEELDVLLGRD